MPSEHVIQKKKKKRKKEKNAAFCCTQKYKPHINLTTANSTFINVVNFRKKTYYQAIWIKSFLLRKK